MRCWWAMVAAGVLACGNDGARPTRTVTAPDSASQVMETFEHYVTAEGVRRAHVQADTAFMYEDTQATLLRNVRAVFYDETGREASTLTAEQATYQWQTGSMRAEGDVVVRSVDGAVLRSEALEYDRTADQISTDQPFTYDADGEHLEGTAFRSDPDFSNIVTDQPRGTAGGEIVVPGQDEP